VGGEAGARGTISQLVSCGGFIHVYLAAPPSAATGDAVASLRGLLGRVAERLKGEGADKTRLVSVRVGLGGNTDGATITAVEKVLDDWVDAQHAPVRALFASLDGSVCIQVVARQ
jgi:enamine deaminase RidA (YjgF/YER057c/UK114 family)